MKQDPKRKVSKQDDNGTLELCCDLKKFRAWKEAMTHSCAELNRDGRSAPGGRLLLIFLLISGLEYFFSPNAWYFTTCGVGCFVVFVALVQLFLYRLLIVAPGTWKRNWWLPALILLVFLIPFFTAGSVEDKGESPLSLVLLAIRECFRYAEMARPLSLDWLLGVGCLFGEMALIGVFWREMAIRTFSLSDQRLRYCLHLAESILQEAPTGTRAGIRFNPYGPLWSERPFEVSRKRAGYTYEGYQGNLFSMELCLEEGLELRLFLSHQRVEKIKKRKSRFKGAKHRTIYLYELRDPKLDLPRGGATRESDDRSQAFLASWKKLIANWENNRTQPAAAGAGVNPDNPRVTLKESGRRIRACQVYKSVGFKEKDLPDRAFIPEELVLGTVRLLFEERLKRVQEPLSSPMEAPH